MPLSIEERDPLYKETDMDVSGLDFPEPGTSDYETDESGRLVEIAELEPVEKAHAETSLSVFQELGIVADKERAKALATLLRGKTPASVIKKRQGKGGQTFSYVPGWYVKKMLNAIFALSWDFELVPVSEGNLYSLTSRQVIVIGKLTIRDIHGEPRIVKMGIGKKDIAYPKPVDGKQSTTPMDLGNDIKAAETDALKRCGTAIGIALDLYQD